MATTAAAAVSETSGWSDSEAGAKNKNSPSGSFDERAAGQSGLGVAGGSVHKRLIG